MTNQHKLITFRKSRPISSKWPFAYLRKTCHVSFKTSFVHSSRFNSPPLSFKKTFPSYPTLSRGPEVGWLHLFHISNHLWFNLIDSPPISNWPWCHPVGRLHPVSLLVNNTFSPPFLRLPWSHPVTIQFMKLPPKINQCQNSPALSFFLSIYYS